MNKSILAVVSILLLLTPTARAESYQAKMKSWVGNHADQLMDSWGYPTREMEIRGYKVYAYENTRQFQVPSFQTPSTYYGGTVIHGATIGGGIATRTCNTYFEVNDDEIITNVRWSGNACR